MDEENESEPSIQHNTGYSWQVGSVYVFNLMIATGLLALPKAFAEVGWVLGLVGLCILAFMSYCTVTFVIEAQSIHNAFLRYNLKIKEENKGGGNDKEVLKLHNIIIENKHSVEEYHNDVCVNNFAEGEIQRSAMQKQNPVVKNHEDVAGNNNTEKAHECDLASRQEVVISRDDNLFEITEKAELGELCQMFFNKIGIILYYIAICLYLYGTQSTYFAAIAKSFTSVVCGNSNYFDGNDTAPCPNIKNLSVIHTYRIMLAIFVILCCPFIFFTLTKTKMLQIITMVFRWFAVISMITLAIIKIGNGCNNIPNLVVFKKLPNFVGVTLFGFMCQYSIANVITPIANKKRLKLSMIFVYVCVVIVNVFIVMTAVYAFKVEEIHDLYTSNFTHPILFKYVLELFPVFALSTNIPILGIALRENLKTLFLSKGEEKYGILLRRVLFPLLVIIPPIGVAYTTYNVGMLAGYTGAYAGAIIQYVVPAMLVYCARKKARQVFGNYRNIYRSPLHHRIWIYFVLIWYLICLTIVTLYKVTS